MCIMATGDINFRLLGVMVVLVQETIRVIIYICNITCIHAHMINKVFVLQYLLEQGFSTVALKIKLCIDKCVTILM